MATPVGLVDSRDTWGGLRDGYRRAQPGVPTSTVGQAPQFRGVKTTPGQDVPAPKILASAARNNQGTNVGIPYARKFCDSNQLTTHGIGEGKRYAHFVSAGVCPANELANVGRLNTGDVCFMQRRKLADTSRVRARYNATTDDIDGNANLAGETLGRMDNSTDGRGAQRRGGGLPNHMMTSAVFPHSAVSRLAGIDYINRALGPDNYEIGGSILADSVNPADDWRSLRVLNEWVLDGVVMSNDNPHFYLSTSEDVRNDQLFNVCVQGTCQVNNGYGVFATRPTSPAPVTSPLR